MNRINTELKTKMFNIYFKIKKQLKAVSKRQTLYLIIEREKILYFLYVLNASDHPMYEFFLTDQFSHTIWVAYNSIAF